VAFQIRIEFSKHSGQTVPFKLYTSNRLEILSDELAKALSQPLLSPFDPEIIVVQSKGMERWISMELARKQGICANVRFPFPYVFVYDILKIVFPDVQTDAIAGSDGISGDGISGFPEKSIYDPPVLTWKIMKILPDCLERAEFGSIKSYLAEPASALKRLQLSTRIADLFDQYLLFRPDLILKWEKGEEHHWQAALWRELTKGNENLHRAALGKQLIETLEKPDEVIPGLPARVTVFGISALPEFYMHVFSALSMHAEVNLFLMNPCREYWGDIVSDAEIRRAAKRKKAQDLTLDLFHFEKGNSLLASMGKLGRDFFDLIEELNYEPSPEFKEPENGTLLSLMQSDILKLMDRGLTGFSKKLISEPDRSVQIHSCHSPRREIEVLQDHLLDMFENDPALKPGDILVMTPDIEPYAPYIQAVFDLPHKDPRRIPYSMADRSYGKESEVVETFLAILDLHGSRFGAAQVLTILEAPAVRKRFEITEDDLDVIQAWVRETRIRWARDAHDRSKMGLPEYPQNTWQAGLERLLLGYALPAREERLFDNSILPYDNIEGSQASVLGKFLEFTELLFNKIESFDEHRTLQEWRSALDELLDSFFAADDETMAEIQVIRQALVAFEDFQDLSGFEEPIELGLVKHFLETRLHKEGRGHGFLSGGVTFCSMLPMRSIPAKVICLIGMNGDAYPRATQQLGFDLMAQHPKRGDRSRRNDDRYLFLEALLSARDKLYISYVGQSIKDNSPIPPSVVVSELMDYIESNFEMGEGKIREQINTDHRLQAFSPEYFKESEKYFSYSKENMGAAMRLLQPRQAPSPFISQNLPGPGEELKKVSLQDLYRFFRNPARFLLNKRLGVWLEEGAPVLEEKESFALRGLDGYKIGEALVERCFAGGDLVELKQLKMAAGQLPHGVVGEHEYDHLSETVRHFVTKTRQHVQTAFLEPLEVDLELNGFHVTGRIDKITGEGITIYRYARVRAKDHLLAWLNHLALTLSRGNGNPVRTFLAGIDKSKDGNWVGFAYRLVSNSEEILTRLLQIYWEGLTKPIHFFPDSALAFARAINDGKSTKTALYRAGQAWFGGSMERGEKEDLYFQLCFGRVEDPMDEEFQELAKDIFLPVLAGQEELQ
jgi:exodeoxyribonuclease V gamma subunit